MVWENKRGKGYRTEKKVLGEEETGGKIERRGRGKGRRKNRGKRN